MSQAQLTVTPYAYPRSASATLLRGNLVVVRLVSDNWAILAAAVLIALGYESLRLELVTGSRTINEPLVQAFLRNQPSAIFKPAAASKGIVVLIERYSETFGENRLDLVVNGTELGDSIPALLRWQDINSLLTVIEQIGQR